MALSHHGRAGPFRSRAGIDDWPPPRVLPRHPSAAAPEPTERVGATALLFPVFLLLAACLAALAARGPLDPERLAPAAAAPAPVPAEAERPAGDGPSLADLERLRPLLDRGAEPGDFADPMAASQAAWRLRVAVRDLFGAEPTADHLRPERLAFLYRLAELLDALAPEGVTLELATDPGPDPATAPARLAEVARRLVDLGAPADALRVRSPHGGAPVAAEDATVDFALSPVTWRD